jgi:hypothetical protein
MSGTWSPEPNCFRTKHSFACVAPYTHSTHPASFATVQSTSMSSLNFPTAFCTDQYISVCTKDVQVHTHQEAVHSSFQSGTISFATLTSLLSTLVTWWYILVCTQLILVCTEYILIYILVCTQFILVRTQYILVLRDVPFCIKYILVHAQYILEQRRSCLFIQGTTWYIPCYSTVLL